MRGITSILCCVRLRHPKTDGWFTIYCEGIKRIDRKESEKTVRSIISIEIGFEIGTQIGIEGGSAC